MADEPAGGEQTPPQEPQGGQGPQGEPKGEQKPPWGSDNEFNPEKAWKLIQNVRSDAEKQKAERERVAAELKKREDAEKSETQKLEERSTTAEQRATRAETEAARLRVALKKGLTETQAKRLVGETEQELEADADELVASFKANGDEPGRRPKERLRPGAAPGAEPGESDPKKLAEQVPRGW